MNLEFPFKQTEQSRTTESSDTLEGILERIIYLNEENDYTVAKFQVDQEPDLVTAVGNFGIVQPGERVALTGAWINDPRFGRQFKAQQYRIVFPSTHKGIINFLSSGMIHGIGQKYAERIVDQFGLETIQVISESPERLHEVTGLGKKRIEKLVASWQEHYAVRDIMMFLQGYDISASHASRIFKMYGQKAIEVVKKNPYRLASEVHGIGFISADRIAAALGFTRQDPLRIASGILYVLEKLTESGHVYYPKKDLFGEAARILEVDEDTLKKALADLIDAGHLQICDTHLDPEGVYLIHLLEAEIGVADQFKRLQSTPSPLKPIDVSSLLIEAADKAHIKFSSAQKDALELGLHAKVAVITGGPGTGKTTILNTLVSLYKSLGLKCLLAAPTGRAAKRLQESTGTDACTIHRLLEYNPKWNQFGKNAENPLDTDVVLIDEASMIDLLLSLHLLAALPDGCIFILIGDADQLPSVGPGTLLKDVIRSEAIPTIHLDYIFRQSEDSSIIMNAHRINKGEYINKSSSPDGHFFFVEKDDLQDIQDVLLELASERIPAKFGFDPIRQVQILSPMYKTLVGVKELNLKLQNKLNKNSPVPIRRHLNLAKGDKIMQTSNNYDKDIFNGDIGFIENIDTDKQTVQIRFDSRLIDFTFLDMDDVVLAYAITIHKSQGSEYDAVLVPVTTAHYTMLQRNLIYTAVTRGKKLVVLVGQKKAMHIAIANNNIEKRYSDLAYRIKS